MFLECACDVRPRLLEVLFTILGEEGSKGALLSKRMGHIAWLELLYFPVVNGLIIPGCG